MLDSKVISGDKLPRFVTMKAVALRLINQNGKWCYYRDGGDWSVGIKIEDKKIFTSSGISTSMNGVELTPITEEAWRKCNGQYAPKYPEPLGSTINAIELSWLDGAAQATSTDKNYKNLLIRRYARNR
jgi:hypothetical protein